MTGSPRDASAPPAYRQLRLCGGGGGYEAIPSRPLVLDLPRIGRRLGLAGVSVTDARVLLIVSMTVEVTVSRAGRLLFKTQDPAAAARAFEQVLPFLGAGSRDDA